MPPLTNHTETQQNTYSVYAKCANCGFNGDTYLRLEIKIPKGIRIQDFLRTKECSKCGCCSLRQD